MFNSAGFRCVRDVPLLPRARIVLGAHRGVPNLDRQAFGTGVAITTLTVGEEV